MPHLTQIAKIFFYKRAAQNFKINASSQRESDLFNQGLLPYIGKLTNGSRKGCLYGWYGHRKYIWKPAFFLILYYWFIYPFFNLKALKFIILVQTQLSFIVWKHVSNITKTTTFIVRNKEGIDMKIHLYEKQKISKSFLLRCKSFVY